MLDNMLYHKIVIDSSFSNELYPCAPIVRLVIFSRLVAARAAMTHRVQGFVPYKGMKSEQPGL